METALVKRENHAISDIERMGQYMAQSGLFGIKNQAQAVALMLIAQAEGYHPAYAARDYDVIQNRPALKAKAKQARYQASGGKVQWKEYTDTKCTAIFTHPQSPEPLTITWDMERAKTAGLAGKDNWKKYPRQMLSSRVISEGVDKSYPDAGGLMYVPEEVMDFDDAITVTSEPITIQTPPKSLPPSKPKQVSGATKGKTTPDQFREKIREIVKEISSKTGDSVNDILERATTNTDKNGKTWPGVRNIEDITDKAAPVNYAKVNDYFVAWKLDSAGLAESIQDGDTVECPEPGIGQKDTSYCMLSCGMYDGCPAFSN
jgi:hypothetical protein